MRNLVTTRRAGSARPMNGWCVKNCQIEHRLRLRELRTCATRIAFGGHLCGGTGVANCRRMVLQDGVHRVQSLDLPAVVDVWEASIRDAHRLVSDAYLQFFKPLVRNELLAMVDVAGVRSSGGALVGFVAIAGTHVEALFVHPAWRRKGVGRRLVRHAVNAAGVLTVDLDDGNTPAIALFRTEAFAVEHRWSITSLGRTFPMIRMRRSALLARAFTARS